MYPLLCIFHWARLESLQGWFWPPGLIFVFSWKLCKWKWQESGTWSENMDVCPHLFDIYRGNNPLTIIFCCIICAFADLGAQWPQRQRLLHRLRGRGAAVRPFQLQAQLWRHADRLGSDRIPGLPAQDGAHRRQRRSGRAVRRTRSTWLMGLRLTFNDLAQQQGIND